MEIKELYIKNFRNIGEEGAEIKLSPITIFTGCNSAGKSTAAKALLLLEAYLSDVKANNYNLIDTPLDFSKVVKLGTFDTVLNSSAKANGQESFVLGYSFASPIIVGDIKVRLTFVKRVSDTLNNAWLQKLSVFIDTIEVFVINVIEGHYSIDVSHKEEFVEYVNYYLVRQIVSICREKLEDLRVNNPVGYSDLSKNWNNGTGRHSYARLRDIEKNLVNKNILRDILWLEDVDKSLKKTLSKKDIICAIENIVSFSDFDMAIYDTEVAKGCSLDAEDIKAICDRMNGEFYDKLFESSGEDWMKNHSEGVNDILGKRSSGIRKYIQNYLTSDNQTIIEYKKGQNISILQKSCCSLNEALVECHTSNCLFDQFALLDLLPIGCRLVIENLLHSVFGLSILGKIGYVDSSTVEVRRLYPLDYSDRFGNLWKSYNQLADTTYEKGEFLRKWLKEFNICDDIIVENLEGTISIKLISRTNPEGRLLADYGYGVTQIIALLLNIEIAISRKETDFVRYAGQHDDSQPYISDRPSFLVIEEPEVHLHPNLQSRLADMFLDASQKGIRFIVETHSEYMVRRSQVIVGSGFSKTSEYRPPFRVYYFPEDGNPYDMRYKTNGHFMESFGEGFFDEAGKWSRELMRSKKK